MSRLWILSVVVFSGAALAQDSNAVLDEARAVMREGLERELPAPTLKGPPQWPGAQPAPGQLRKEEVPKKDGAKDSLKETARETAKESAKESVKDSLGERVRNEASLRARAAAEERRSTPDNNQGVGQSRTKAAKAMGPKPKPPRP